MRGRRRASAEVHEAARIVLEWIGEEVDSPSQYEVIRRDRHSNSVDEVHLEDGRILVVKRARDPANTYRFEASRIVSDLLSDVPDVLVPRYLPVPPQLEGEPVLIYWWVSGPTLSELWPEIDQAERPAAVRSWGALTRRIQEAELPGYGPVVEASQREVSLPDFLEHDLGERLLPSVAPAWSEGEPAVRGLLEGVPELVGEVGPHGPVLVHNDLFDQNVLCRREDGGVACVGAIDFEDALAAPPEAELAKTEILHGPLFGQSWEWDWFPHLVEGWGREPNAFALTFFRAYQLVNMGFHAQVSGMTGHADEVAAVARREVEGLGAGRRHREVCGLALA